jgi:hypothetical protein
MKGTPGRRKRYTELHLLLRLRLQPAARICQRGRENRHCIQRGMLDLCIAPNAAAAAAAALKPCAHSCPRRHALKLLAAFARSSKPVACRQLLEHTSTHNL